MTIGALLDLGADKELLIDGLSTLAIDGYKLDFGRTKKASIDAYDFNVTLIPDSHEHKHELEHSHTLNHEHSHEMNSIHHHEHETKNSHLLSEILHHLHRNLELITKLINNSQISQRAKKMSIKTFEIIAEAEAKAHGIELHEVHFHEVGAIDSIIDVVGISILLDYLNVNKIICSPLSEGTGYVTCAHGTIPVPVPAVLNIATSYQVPLLLTNVKGEMVTPTGIAAMCAWCDAFTTPEMLMVKKVGYGAGNKNFDDRANVLRVLLLKEQDIEQDQVILLETNIDDQSPELLAYATQLLTDSNALDVWLEPILMKKGRSAHKLCVLCKEEDNDTLVYLIFKHTTSIGIRKSTLEREVMTREFIPVSTEYGEVITKKCTFKDIEKVSVEFESAKKIALQHNITVEAVISKIFT